MRNRTNNRLTLAVRALMRAIKRSPQTAIIADTLVENYRALHAKAAEHYPHDDYINTVLVLNIPAEADERQKAALVRFAVLQLHTYLSSLNQPGRPMRRMKARRFQGGRPMRRRGPRRFRRDNWNAPAYMSGKV